MGKRTKSAGDQIIVFPTVLRSFFIYPLIFIYLSPERLQVFIFFILQMWNEQQSGPIFSVCSHIDCKFVMSNIIFLLHHPSISLFAKSAVHRDTFTLRCAAQAVESLCMWSLRSESNIPSWNLSVLLIQCWKLLKPHLILNGCKKVEIYNLSTTLIFSWRQNVENLYEK